MISKSLVWLVTAPLLFSADPLPSWNNTASRKAIVSFVERITKEHSPDFIRPQDRIAVFDNDGTLWAEKPMRFQAYFALDRVKELAPLHPEWKTKEPFASVLRDDVQGALAGGERAITELLTATHTGITTTEFEHAVYNWIGTARHPTTHRFYTEMVYQPMVELLAYLRANGFKIFLVCSGGTDFMRPWAERVYGIPPEQVIGSTVKTRLEMRDGVPVLVRLPEIEFIDDDEGKPLAIHSRIGRRPIAAFGNSDKDLLMMQYIASAPGPRLCVFLHHTDGDREWAYDRRSTIGMLDKGLDEAKAKGWTVIDMKRDWKWVFVFEEATKRQSD